MHTQYMYLHSIQTNEYNKKKISKKRYRKTHKCAKHTQFFRPTKYFVCTNFRCENYFSISFVFFLFSISPTNCCDSTFDCARQKKKKMLYVRSKHALLIDWHFQSFDERHGACLQMALWSWLLSIDSSLMFNNQRRSALVSTVSIETVWCNFKLDI